MLDQILPIGTVVKVKQNSFMIVGYNSKGFDNPDHIYDYSCLLHPMGLSGDLDIYQFDTEQIEDIMAYGYQDKEQMVFMENYKIKKATQKEEKGE
jgi:hypothetical protein